MWDRSKLGLIFFVLLTFLIAGYSLWQEKNGGLSAAFSCISYPIIKLNSKIAAIFGCEKYRNREDLERINQELQGRLQDLMSKNIALHAESKYWCENKEIIEFRQRYHDKRAILAQVFFKNLSVETQNFLLDKGKLSGVQNGMVVVYKHFLIGKVTEVYPVYSKAILITDQNCKVAVYSEKTKALGITSGINDLGQISLNYVSHLQYLEQGDVLVSSGEGESFPEGFGVGAISNFKVDGMYYKVQAKPLIDLAQLKYCYLITANKA